MTNSIRRSNRLIYVATGIIVGLLLSVAAFAYTNARLGDTNSRLDDRVECINRTLKYRQDAIDADHDAEVTKVREQRQAEQLKGEGLERIVDAGSDTEVRTGLRLFREGQVAFEASLDHFLAAIAATDKIRQAHPLGEC